MIFDSVKVSLYTLCGLVGLSNAYAACNPHGPPLTSATIDNFLRNPEIILSYDASSKLEARELSFSVTQFVAAGPDVIQTIKSILPSATLQQRTAIGEGLFGAVTFCRAVDPTFATRIESAVKSISDRDVIYAYQHAANLSLPSTYNSRIKSSTGFVSTTPPAHARALIGEPSPTDPGSLKLSDPFGSPDAWR